MTTPPAPQDGTLSQILIAIGEIKTQQAVMLEMLKALPDHESRLRALETQAASSAGGRDTWARVAAGLGLAGGTAAAIANFIHH